MKLLEDKILQEGKVLGDDILKVDSFVSHQVDVNLMEELGKDMAEHFRGQGVTKVFTNRGLWNRAGAFYRAEPWKFLW